MPMRIVRNDIIKMQVDVIVNAANEDLLMGSGVCGAIFSAAGAEQLQDECYRIGHCSTGQAVITRGYRLPAKHIIHTVGPIWRGGLYGEETQLRSCYTQSMKLAKLNGLVSIAFPLISSGIYGFPKDQAISIAVSEIGSFLLKNDMDVFLVIFGTEPHRLSERLDKSIAAYIGERIMPSLDRMCMIQGDGYTRHKVGVEVLPQATSADARTSRAEAKHKFSQSKIPTHSASFDVCMSRAGLERVVKSVGESFTEMLFRLIDEGKLSDPQVYHHANLDRRLFSKIRSNPQYRPSKNTALALAVALRLNLDQTIDLLARAGYAFSPASKFDLIVEYFIQEENFNIFEINEALFAFDESLLGA